MASLFKINSDSGGKEINFENEEAKKKLFEMDNIRFETKWKLEKYRSLKTFLSMHVSDIETNAETSNGDEFYSEFTRRMCTNFEITFDIKQKLPTSFESAKHYVNSFTPYILIEAWENIVNEYQMKSEELNKSSLKELDFYTSDPIKTILDKIKNEKFLKLLLTCSEIINNISDKTCAINHHLGELECQSHSWLVYISKTKLNKLKSHDSVKYIMTCEVTMLTSNSLSYIEAALNARTNKDGDRIEFKLKPFYYLKQALRQIKTLNVLQKDRPNLLACIEKPNLEVCHLNTINLKSRFRLLEENKFNKSQIEAIIACLNALDQPRRIRKIQLIQGPPGTGKTHTLIGIVENIFSNFVNRPIQPVQLLICAPSNGAVDNIGLRLLAEKKHFEFILNRPPSIIRIGYLPKVHEEVRKVHLEVLTDQQYKIFKVDEQNEQNGKNRLNLRDEILTSADIILSTLGSSHSSSMKVFKKSSAVSSSGINQIRCVIVDEAGQCSEPELLLPLIYPINKLITIGDHKQLPATIISHAASSVKFGRSLFERFVEFFLPKGKNVEVIQQLPIITLTEQYRMRSEIAFLPSKLFYDNQLQTNDGTGLNDIIKVCPYMIFNLTDSEEFSTSTNSKINLKEVLFIRKLLVSLLQRCSYSLLELIETNRKIKEEKESEIKFKKDKEDKSKYLVPFSIGIITFYKGQKAEIVKDLKRFYGGILMNFVRIDTVDAFQGLEMDVIILSCVRANTNSVGFLRSSQRMNVALTRAKSALFLCLQKKAFEMEEFWKELIDDAQSRICIQKVSSEISMEMLMQYIVSEQLDSVVSHADNKFEFPQLELQFDSKLLSNETMSHLAHTFAQVVSSEFTTTTPTSSSKKSTKKKWSKLEL